MHASIKWLGSLLLAAVALDAVAFSRANAALLSFAFSDPAGDSGAAGGDLTSMSFGFDNTTGAFTIQLTADPARPFFGTFRINVNLLNPDTGSESFFSSPFHDFALIAPTTSLVLTGVDSLLLSWSAGQRVAANDHPFGNPAGITAFATELIDLSSTSGAYCELGPADCLSPLDATNFTTIVPEPGSAALFGGALVALVWSRRRIPSTRWTAGK